MNKFVFSLKRQTRDTVNVRIIILWGIFSLAYFAACFLYFGNILTANYKTIYKTHAIFAFLSHSVFFSGIGALIFILLSGKIRDVSISVFFSLTVTIAFLLSLTDIALFKIYHFHINRYVISEMMQPDFASSSGIGTSFIITSLIEFILAAAVISAVTFLFLRAGRPRSGMPIKRALRFIAIVMTVVVIAEKIFMLLISYNRPAYIYELEESVPVFYVSVGEYLYKPLRSRIDISDGKESYDTLSSEYRDCSYPMPYDKDAARIRNKKNVIIIMTESTRWDVIDGNTTPTIYDLSRANSLVSEYHFSGSNSTHLGLFSALYGINPFYNIYVKTKKIESFPIRVLRDNGYRTHLFMSASSKWHRMDLFLNPNFDEIYMPRESTSLTRDAEISREVTARIMKMGSTPNFFFVFFDSSHYPFYFPERNAPFSPYFKGIFDKTDFMMLSEKKGLLMNSYRNSLHYLDGLIGNIISGLKSSGHYNDTIIVYSGDHGCEFGETGKYFYSSSLSSYATRVPLIIRDSSLPKNIQVRLSSHIDIMPTLFDLLGYSGDRSNLQGKSLLTRNGNPYAIVTYQDVLTPYKYSVIDDRYKLVVDFKSARFIVERNDIHDIRAETINDEKKRIDFLKQQMKFFIRNNTAGVNK